MNDLIRRENAIEILSERAESLRGVNGDLGGACRGAMRIIESLPSAEPERKWIPVTEALPEENKNVLVTTIDGERRVSHLTDITYWWNIGRGKVLAWMPLPEPYRGE